jgi:hypothetical protein
MYTFLTELQTRPDGIVNNSVTSRSSVAAGLSLYFDRASKAVVSTQFTKVALTLEDQNGNILENRAFDTLYKPDEEDTTE